MVAVPIEGRSVWVRPWVYLHICPHGHQIPILLLDTDLEQNEAQDQKITHYLYGDGDDYRLKQEIVLGIGGIRILHALGFDLHTYHLNEGHAALLTLDLLNRWRVPSQELAPGEPPYDIAEVRERCVFTTHTPVEAGHDKFSYELFQRLLPDFVDMEALRSLAGTDRLNMTRLAFNLSGYVNGVARRHAQTTQRMFPGYHIHAITNGVHVATWTHDAFIKIYDSHFHNWQHEPEVLVRALQLPDEEVFQAHIVAKGALISRVKSLTGVELDPEKPIVAFARRMTSYKRPLLLFSDLERLIKIADTHPFQIILAGKAHPHDDGGKEEIRNVFSVLKTLEGKIPGAFLPDYEMDLAKSLVSGSDIWLNTPLAPMEASGTSGMKAALNGVLNFSILDGWWIEACVDGVNGWSIGSDGGTSAEGQDAIALYDKLGGTVLPLYYESRKQWLEMMKQAIGTIAYYFNSQRMMRRYATEAYLR